MNMTDQKAEKAKANEEKGREEKAENHVQSSKKWEK